MDICDRASLERRAGLQRLAELPPHELALHAKLVAEGPRVKVRQVPMTGWCVRRR